MATKTASVVTGGTNQAPVTAEEINALQTDLVAAGVVGTVTLNTGSGGSGSFAINAQGTPAMSVRISAGQAYVTATPTGGNSQLVRCKMTTFEDVTIAANATGGTRYDWVYLIASATTLATPGAAKDDVFTLSSSRSTSSSTDNGTPPTYGLLLGVVTVANGASSITNSNITDSRVQAGVSGIKGDALLTQSAAGTDAKVTAVGLDANIHIAATPKGNGLFKGAVLRQDDTTNTYQKGNTITLTGWGVMVPGAASNVQETVTFGVTFAARPIVIATYGGDHASATTYGSGGVAVNSGYASAHTITTTSCVVRVVGSGAWSGVNTVFYQWVAIGELA